MVQQITFRAMGCQILAVVDATSGEAGQALAQVPRWFAEWEQHLSRFREESELVNLNRANSCAVQVSQTLWDVIDLVLAGAQQSGGLVVPTMLHALEAAGYTQSWAEQPQANTSATANQCSAANQYVAGDTWQQIERDPQTMTIRLPAGVRLDLGGIGKGWAAHQAAQRLNAYGPALVDAGGDIAISRPTACGEPWQIDVADPFSPERDLVTLLVEQGGVATSGRDYRCWQRDGRDYHHIIDPRTNAPAQTDVLSATVVAPTVYEAEIGAKAALILGSSAGLNWLRARPQCAGVLVLDDGSLLHTQRLQNVLAHSCRSLPNGS